MNKTIENGKKPNSGSNFGLFCTNVPPPPPKKKKKFFMGFTYTRCQTLLQAIIIFNFKGKLRSKLKKMEKNVLS